MKIQSIKFFPALEELDNIFDDNVDVILKLDDGYQYVVVVATPQNLLTLMDESDFLPPCDPMIIVQKLTKESIKKAIEAYLENDAYYLKVYDATLDINTLHVLRDRKDEERKICERILEAEALVDRESEGLSNFT